MIISKDLFIFGEHIFATIIPEIGTQTTNVNVATAAAAAATTNETATLNELQQQSRQILSQPINLQNAIAEVALKVAVKTTAAAAAVATTEQVCLSKTGTTKVINTTTNATTTTTQTVATPTKTQYQKETVESVRQQQKQQKQQQQEQQKIKEQNKKTKNNLKIPKDKIFQLNEQQQQQQHQQQAEEKTKNITKKQQNQQQQQSVSCVKQVTAADEKELKTELSQQQKRKKQQQQQQNLSQFNEIDEEEEAEVEAAAAAAVAAKLAHEKEPLVKRNPIKIIDLANTITTTPITTTKKPAITKNFILQQKKQELNTKKNNNTNNTDNNEDDSSDEFLSLLLNVTPTKEKTKTTTEVQQLNEASLSLFTSTLPLASASPSSSSPQSNQQQVLYPKKIRQDSAECCRLQIEVTTDNLHEQRQQLLPAAAVAATAAVETAATAKIQACLSSSSSSSSSSSIASSLAPSSTATTATPATTINMGKVILGNTNSSSVVGSNNTTSARNDHAMATFPFLHDHHRTLQLTFQNISVLHNERKILSDVSGLVSPGEVLAIMGPSGSGKTTLLDCISGQRRVDSGTIFLNREPISKKWRRKICYVLQEEVFFSGLTLRETVMYTALLRLPEKMPKAEKIKLVDRILQTLELNCCQQTKFGDYMNRGLSGGEKKRANIACELLTNPLLMLLDEPTSGLDSHSAISLMKVLKRYALQEQKTVVITVHQPSSQMFHMFDKLLLLYNGRTAYFGEVNNIYSYFEDIGVAIKPHYNPADFVLEQLKSYPDIREKLFVAAKESHGNFLNRNCITYNNSSSCNNKQISTTTTTVPQHHIAHQNEHHINLREQQNGCITGVGGVDVGGGQLTITATNGNSNISTKSSQKHDALINDIINNYYKDIHHHHHNHHLLHHHHHHHINHADSPMLIIGDGSNDTHHHLHHHDNCVEDASQQLWCATADSQSNFSSSSSDYQQYESSGGDWLDYPTRFHTQFRVLLSRNFKEAKPMMLSKLNWFQTIGLALMAGAIWFQLPRTEEFLHDLQGWMFFSQTYWMLFALFGALNSFPAEREVISKERRSGAYRLSAYYLAKMFGELPLVITLPTVYLIISYPMLGCASLKLFFLMLVFLLLNTIVAQSVGFFIGACCMDMNVSITLSALYTLATQLFGGYLSSRIPEGLSWIRYTSMIHYAYQNMQILEFREGPDISCGDPSSFEICKSNSTTFIPYEEILKAQNSSSPLWLNTLVLMMFFMVFRILGYAVLRYIRCPKT